MLFRGNIPGARFEACAHVHILSIYRWMAEVQHSIKFAARKTGLTPHVIRVWERRYEAVSPNRTGTNRRMYSEGEIERLGLLRDVTQAGHSIGQVARLPLAKLRQLAADAGSPKPEPSARPARKTSPDNSLLEDCVEAVKSLDAHALENALKRAATALGSQGLLQRVVAPLAQTIGDLWRDGSITAAHEHFASATIRIFLGHAARPFAATEGAPVIVVATPTGQIHELGALLVGAAAANLGWHVTYLGASLPAAEIAGAARQSRARAVALSLVYPEDDPRLEAELKGLRHLLPDEVALLVGGRAMPSYGDALEKIGAIQLKDLSHFCVVIDELRKPAKKANR